MKLYIYGDDNGKWYCGRSPAGRVKTTDDFTEATMFTEETVHEAEDCIMLGLNLYSIEISQPQLETQGDGSFPNSGSSFNMKDWEIHSMNLFGDKEDNQ